MERLDATAVVERPVEHSVERPIDGALVDKMLSNSLSEAEARQAVLGDPECLVFTLLALQVCFAGLAQSTGANTPSSAIPPYEKPTTQPQSNRNASKKNKRGGQQGHPGKTREPLGEPDRTRNQQLDCCPDCAGQLTRTGKTRKRRSEDIPEDLKSVVTEDTIHRDYCPNCKKYVEPKLPDVLPRCTLGNRVLVLSALLHFLQGLSLGQIVDTFNFHLRMKVTPGGLIQMWHRLADLLFAWYEQIHQESLASAKLHADETGWRVGGKTHWLWCFANDENVFYTIDRSRGSPALNKFFTEAFEGTLISDFWGPYDAVICGDKQKCWPHLLRDAAKVSEKHGEHPDWKSFSRRLVSAYRAAKKLHAQKATMPAPEYDLAVVRLEARLAKLGSDAWEHPDANRLSKRMGKYGNELLTFLWYDDIPSDNNAAERAIRPAVMIRKNSYCNHTDRGALTQSVLMTVFRTLKARGHQPIDTILKALETYAKTGQMPSIPARAAGG